MLCIREDHGLQFPSSLKVFLRRTPLHGRPEALDRGADARPRRAPGGRAPGVSGPALRSREWLDSPELYGWLRRAALRSQGFGEHALDGSPVIGVCSSWSELTHCNAHLRTSARP